MLAPAGASLIRNKPRVYHVHTKHSINHSPSHRRQAILMGLSALALAGLHAPQARADILAFSTNVNPQLFNAGPAPVDLSEAAGIQNTLSFTTNALGLVEITFSAECSVEGGRLQYGTIQILVKPAGAGGFGPIPPTAGPDDAFCSGDGDPADILDALVTPSITVIAEVPAGVHEVQVQADPVAGAPQFRLDDLSITVDN
jgi:hypothetical protein